MHVVEMMWLLVLYGGNDQHTCVSVSDRSGFPHSLINHIHRCIGAAFLFGLSHCLQKINPPRKVVFAAQKWNWIKSIYLDSRPSGPSQSTTSLNYGQTSMGLMSCGIMTGYQKHCFMPGGGLKEKWMDRIGPNTLLSFSSRLRRGAEILHHSHDRGK